MSRQAIPPTAATNGKTTTQRTPYVGDPKAATITPAEEIAFRDNCYRSPNNGDSQQPSVPTFGKRDASNTWTTSQRKQQRTQQRAFTSRRDNPFAFFQHDPNDAESFLEGLSQSNTQPNNGIIPEEELRKFSDGTKRRGRFARPQPTRSNKPIERRRRQGTGSSKRVSNQDVLRMKAMEASSYSVGFVPSQASPYSTFATPPPNQDRSVGMDSGPSRYSPVRAAPYSGPAATESAVHQHFHSQHPMSQYDGVPVEPLVNPMPNNIIEMNQYYDDVIDRRQQPPFTQQPWYPPGPRAQNAGEDWNFSGASYHPPQPGFVSQELSQDLFQMDDAHDWSSDYYPSDQPYFESRARPMPEDRAFGPQDLY
jgi:hypothetical protein